MTYDEDLAKQAQEYANFMAAGNVWAHSAGSERPDQGENLAMAYGNDTMLTTAMASEMWYDEITDPGYDFNDPGYYENPGAGHFTAMVWKSTTHVGFGAATSSDGKHYVVGRYSPPGNWTNDG